MNRAICLVVAAVALVGCSTSSSYRACGLALDGPVEAQFRAMGDCVFAAARRLEPSGEAAPVVAEAAVSACQPQISTYQQASLAAECYPPDITRSNNANVRGVLAREAQALVVELRASRTAPRT